MDSVKRKCITQKKTTHVTNSCSVEGKQIITDSPSFVWVPIIVQEEAFDALAAVDVKSKKVITNEDVRDLEILAGTVQPSLTRQEYSWSQRQKLPRPLSMQ